MGRPCLFVTPTHETVIMNDNICSKSSPNKDNNNEDFNDSHAVHDVMGDRGLNDLDQISNDPAQELST